jgi:Ca-activated chloride channel family protein
VHATRHARRWTACLVALGVGATLALAGCSGDEPAPTATYDADPKTLSIVAGSEQQSVIDTIVKPWCSDRGYRCTFTSKGSVDQARLLSGGNRDHDAYWFASSVFLQFGDTANALQDVKPMFLTPVVFAGRRSEMTELGFAGRTDVTVGQILDAVESGRTRVWVTNPTQSNSGATVLFGFLNHVAGNPPGTALTQAQLDSPEVEDGIRRFVAAVDATPPSTGTLMTECLAHPDTCRTMFTYEDLVIERNAELVAAGQEPLVVAYPRGALAVSDAPLGFVPHGTAADADKRRALTELQNHLLTDPGAQAALHKLGRRPVSGVGLRLDNPDRTVFNPDWGIQATINEQPVQYPATPVIKAALERYQTRYRRPVDTYYCLDGSGSMGDNDGWTGIKAAAEQVFDPDQAALNLLQTHPEDVTTVAVFHAGQAAGPWRVDGDDAGKLRELTADIDGYTPSGGTNMYGCLLRATEQIGPSRPGRKRLVVLMSDGQSEDAERRAAVQAVQRSGVPVVAIAFGNDADPAQLQEVATATGGTFVQQNDLVAALRQAAGFK